MSFRNIESVMDFLGAVCVFPHSFQANSDMYGLCDQLKGTTT